MVRGRNRPILLFAFLPGVPIFIYNAWGFAHDFYSTPVDIRLSSDCMAHSVRVRGRSSTCFSPTNVSRASICNAASRTAAIKTVTQKVESIPTRLIPQYHGVYRVQPTDWFQITQLYPVVFSALPMLILLLSDGGSNYHGCIHLGSSAFPFS